MTNAADRAVDTQLKRLFVYRLMVNSAGHKSVRRLCSFLPSKLLCVCVCVNNLCCWFFSLYFFFYISVSKSGRYSGLHHGLCETWWAAGIHFGKGVEFYSLCHFVQVTPCTNPTNSVGKRRVRTAPNIHILHCIFFALSQYSFFFFSINMDISWVGIHIVFIVVFTVTPCSLIGC